MCWGFFWGFCAFARVWHTMPPKPRSLCVGPPLVPRSEPTPHRFTIGIWSRLVSTAVRPPCWQSGSFRPCHTVPRLNAVAFRPRFVHGILFALQCTCPLQPVILAGRGGRVVARDSCASTGLGATHWRWSSSASQRCLSLGAEVCQCGMFQGPTLAAMFSSESSGPRARQRHSPRGPGACGPRHPEQGVIRALRGVFEAGIQVAEQPPHGTRVHSLSLQPNCPPAPQLHAGRSISALIFFCIGTALQFWGRLQSNRRRLQPTAVGWRPTAISCSSSSVLVGALVDPQVTRAGVFLLLFELRTPLVARTPHTSCAHECPIAPTGAQYICRPLVSQSTRVERGQASPGQGAKCVRGQGKGDA